MRRLLHITQRIIADHSHKTFNKQNLILKRYDAASAASNSVCWNCKKSTESASQMICAECGHLQNVNAKLNYFELLNLPVEFALDMQELTQRFRQLQMLVHPDKFSNKSERELCNSTEWSSFINKAYKTLAAPIERGRYILQIHGQHMPEHSKVDAEFLMRMMERNEDVDAANTTEELLILQKQANSELADYVVNLNEKFNAKDFDAATIILVQMKYMQSLLQSIRQKLELLRYGEKTI